MNQQLQNLVNELDVLELEERLEMVQLAAAEAGVDNGCCTGNDQDCKPRIN